MHELSLAVGILQTVEDAAQKDGFRCVRALRLEVGPFSGVEVAALRFALESMSGTLLDGAEIVIEQPPAQARCPQCGGSVQVLDRLEPCPICAAHPLQIAGGNTVRVIDLTVID